MVKFEIICGSYEEFLLGYNFLGKGKDLVQSFAAHDHSSSVRCVAFSDRYLASGGADDRIFIYDLATRKELCTLTHHSATVTCLEYVPQHTHLISGSADGSVAIVRVGNWQLEKVWQSAHKGGTVLDIAVHKSGKLALSLGSNGSLCTWNLVKGRQAYVVNLNSKSKDVRSLERILWAPDGVRLVLYGGFYTEIWSIETGGMLSFLKHDQKVTCCIWINNEDDENDLLLCGYEDGTCNIINIETEEKEHFILHENSRVKSVFLYKKYLVSVSSAGQINVFSRVSPLRKVGSTETGCRLTCVCVVPPIGVKEELVDEEVVVEKVVEEERVSIARVVETTELTDDDDDDANNNLVIDEDAGGNSKKNKNKKRKRKVVKAGNVEKIKNTKQKLKRNNL